MSAELCPSPEALFDPEAPLHAAALTHADACEACRALLETHRQLEKDLFRLADPLPPANFTAHVMAKVATAPPRARTEFSTAIGIWTGALALLVATVWWGGNPGRWGLELASVAVGVRGVAVAVAHGLAVLWEAAALQLVLAAGTAFLGSLWMLRRLVGASEQVEVAS